MTSFLFWNTNAQPAGGILAAVVQEYEPDVVILAEAQPSVAALLQSVNGHSRRTYTLPRGLSKRLTFLSRLPRVCVRPLHDEPGIAIRRVVPPVDAELILVAVHLPSKMHLTALDQSHLAIRMRPIIERFEKKLGHTRTLIIGDFNMDPFEDGLVSSEAIHGVMDRRIAMRTTRTVLGAERGLFYNPMWGRMGDSSQGPPGTYYYGSSAPTALFWHTFDQVLLRPSLLSHFQDADVEVITKAGPHSLMNDDGVPNTTMGSDHLPLFVKIRS